jgi:hypothetical protein
VQTIVDNLQQQYLLIGYTIIEEQGIYYVQKQEVIGDSERVSMPELRDKRRDSNIGTFQSIA